MKKSLALRLAAAVLAAAVLPALAAVNSDQAAAAAQRATGGRVLAVEQAQVNNRQVWRVKVITGKGDVRVVLVDAASGQVQQ